MPIKFRCNYCRQFLGISRAQAGGIVDCPTCGRSIRVPLLDGTLQPLPEPELNLQDAHLARALDELARLTSGDSQLIFKSSEAEVDADDDAENEIPQPIPEPIPIEVPIPPTPIAIQPALQDDDEDIADQPTTIGAAPNPAAAKTLAGNLYAELAALTPPEPAPGQAQVEPVPRPVAERRSFASRRSLPYVALLMAVAFVAGMLFERFVKVLEALKPQGQSSASPSDDKKPQAVSELTGRITYKAAEGTSQPDRGARIMVFPQERAGEAKLSIVGFRPADGEADAKIAAASLKALGGAVTTADDEGRFHVDVPAGTYQILVLSHFQPRDEKEPIDAALHKLLTTYFDKPDDLLGRMKFDFGPLKVKGTGDVWDHSF